MLSLIRYAQLYSAIFYIIFHCTIIAAKVVSITEANFDLYTSTHELLFLNFFATWCHFSQQLAPVFDEAALVIEKEFPQNKVLFGSVDSDKEVKLVHRFDINKFPTLKYVRNGKIMKKEYRGPRTVAFLADFIRDLMKVPIAALESQDAIAQVDTKKRKVALFTTSKDSQLPLYNNFVKLSNELREDCQFYLIEGALAHNYLIPPQEAKIVFSHAKSKLGTSENEDYTGSMTSFDELTAWATNRCKPLVREITFENAEELTEEGLPFLILFHHPDDVESPKIFENAVKAFLLDDRTLVNFLTADGNVFEHPLYHLGKTVDDLPVVAIDSFKHMYLFPDIKDINVPGKLKQFVLDLFSGKLHREYHYGPDPAKQDSKPKPVTESVFKKLGPSPRRYTLLKDEL